MMRWGLLLLAIATEVTATMALKAAVDGHSVGWVAAAGYAASFWCLAALLRRGEPIGVIYSIWSAAGVALTAILAVFLFGETLTWPVAVGITLVVFGVILVESSRRTPRAAHDDAPGVES